MILAVTGGIASGKSAFSHALAAIQPFVCFDADAFVHELLSLNQSVISEIRAAFGDRALAPDGTIDRHALRSRVFADVEARKRLETIIHPRVHRRWQQLRSECLAEGRDFLADIPLLFEVGAQECFDASVVVGASPSVQLERLSGRGLTREQAQAMIASQWPLADKLALATVVVWNDGCHPRLEHQAALLALRLGLPQR
ncbi:MAG: dephospho-CoA kinase [Chthoniobacterales bacterium]|nr:dephospho-CoA kinase [Chthoniobacterales bacterium]